MKSVRITAKTVDDAVAEGLAELGISRAEAIVRVIEEPSKGVFGLFAKKAVVDVIAPDLSDEEEEAPAAAPEETEAPAAPEAAEEKEAAPAEEAKDAEAEEAPKAEEAEDAPAAEAEDAAEDKKEKEEFVFSAEEQSATADAAVAFLEGVFKSMGLDVMIEKMMNEERILLSLHGKGLGILIGKHGQTLNSLQYLTNLAAGRLYRHRYFVLLDVENYRTRREDTLQSLARRCAAKVKRTGERYALEPMEPGERRIIHLALQNDPLVATDSEGEGSARHVVIYMK